MGQMGGIKIALQRQHGPLGAIPHFWRLIGCRLRDMQGAQIGRTSKTKVKLPRLKQIRSMICSFWMGLKGDMAK
jgi:hypothetical protein